MKERMWTCLKVLALVTGFLSLVACETGGWNVEPEGWSDSPPPHWESDYGWPSREYGKWS